MKKENFAVVLLIFTFVISTVFVLKPNTVTAGNSAAPSATPRPAKANSSLAIKKRAKIKVKKPAGWSWGTTNSKSTKTKKARKLNGTN